MKTAFSLFSCFLLLSISTKSQVAYQNKINPNDYKPFEIKLKSKNLKNENIQHYFEIIDQRPDTTRLGFMKGEAYTQLYFYFKEPASQYLSHRINQDNNQIFTDSIRIILKRLWVFDSKVPTSNFFDWDNLKAVCFGHVVADIYKKIGNEYFLINRYDSLMKNRGYIGNMADYLLEKNLKELVRSADSIAKIIPADYVNFKKIGDNIDTLAPILLTSLPRDGIYLKFQDFLKNHPSEVLFNYNVQIKKREESLVLHTPVGDDSIYTKHNWGFCKDGIIYMRIGQSFSKLTKIENSFELRGIDIARFYNPKNDTRISLVFLNQGPNNFQFSPIGSLIGTALFLIPMDKRIPHFENIAAYKLDLKTGIIY